MSGCDAALLSGQHLQHLCISGACGVCSLQLFEAHLWHALRNHLCLPLKHFVWLNKKTLTSIHNKWLKRLRSGFGHFSSHRCHHKTFLQFYPTLWGEKKVFFLVLWLEVTRVVTEVDIWNAQFLSLPPCFINHTPGVTMCKSLVPMTKAPHCAQSEHLDLEARTTNISHLYNSAEAAVRGLLKSCFSAPCDT